MQTLKLGSHVGMNGKEMFLGSVKEALSYEANTFMLYTGAPQNTRRKELSQLRIPEAQALMKESGLQEFVVHAPYIINLANTVNPETFRLAVDFLALETERAAAMGSHILINDSKNAKGASKDRHANIGQGTIGLPALHAIVHHPDFMDIPKILETPYIPSPQDPKQTLPPYKEEIALLRGPLSCVMSRTIS